MSKIEGIVISMNGFKLNLFVFVCSNAVVSSDIELQFMWIVPWRSFYGGNRWFLNDLNFGSDFKAIFSFVAAPLY